MIANTKRVLRPFRPILGPIWRSVRRRGGTPRSRAIRRSRLEGRVSDAARAITRRPRSLRTLRIHEISDLAATVPYYRVRGEYIGVACGIADELIRRQHLRTALELGPHLQSLIVGADTMELAAIPSLQAHGRRIVHDATNVPWPVGDKQYGVFMALQVFEHLGSNQPQVFREVRRVARNAIISLPIDWEMADPNNCHHQVSHERALSWFAPVAPTRVVVGSPGRHKRLIYVFEGLPVPDALTDPDTADTRSHADPVADRLVPDSRPSV